MSGFPTALPPPPVWFRLLCFIVGAHAGILWRQPPIEHHAVMKVAGLQLVLLVFQTVAYSYAAMMAFPGDEWALVACCAFGLLVATAFMIADSLMLIQPAWERTGQMEMRKAGYEIISGEGLTAKYTALVAFRLILLIGCSTASATFTAVGYAKTDIDYRLDTKAKAQNTALFDRVTQSYDAETARTDSEREELRKIVLKLQADIATLQRRGAGEAQDDPEIVSILAAIAQLEVRRSAAEKDLAAARVFASDELAGRRGGPANSGVPGAGPRRAAALERVQSAQAALNAIVRELDAAQGRLERARARVTASAGPQRDAINSQIPGMIAERDRIEARLQQLATLSAARVRNREAAIREAAEQAPGYAPVERGPLARVATLQELLADPQRRNAIIGIEGVFVGIELIMMLGKMLSDVGKEYSLAIAEHYFITAATTGERIARAIARLRGDKVEEPVLPGGKPLWEPYEEEPGSSTDPKPKPGGSGSKNPFEEPKRRGRPPGSKNRPPDDEEDP